MIKKPMGNTIPSIRPSPKMAIMVIAMKKMKKMRGKLHVRGHNTRLQKNPLRGGHNGLHLRVTIGTGNEGGATNGQDEKTVPRF